MKSLQNILCEPVGYPITSDDILEFHAARLLLVIKICGKEDRAHPLPRIDGLTKFAKLDFFVRYPTFFQKVATTLGAAIVSPVTQTIESKMVRHHYGPWDKRYYHVIPYLEAKGLINVYKIGAQYRFALTEKGLMLTERIIAHDEFATLIAHMRQVKVFLGNMNGNALKNLIYEEFDIEVTQQKLGEVIEP